MDMNNMAYKTKKAMTKDEVSLLLDLIQTKPIITSKETNASSNKLKDEAWDSVADNFNAKNGQLPRHKDQLKAKWDNLKKAARKRSQQIRLNNIKIGGGKPDFIPHDDILERVAGQLGSTCTGFEVPFGGDGVGFSEEIVLLDGVGICDNISSPALKPTDNVAFEVTTPESKYISMPINEATKRKADEPLKPRCLYGMSNMSKKLQTNKGKKKKYDDNGRREMHLAIKNYYEAKTIKTNLEIDLLRIAIAKKTSQAPTNLE